MQDLLEALVEYYGGNRKYAYQDLDELSEDIKRNPVHTSERLVNMVKKDSVENFLCPHCHSCLKSVEQLANIHGDLDGYTECEYMYLDFCPKCGWSEGDS